jgi:uncharacterized YigZ family protein
MLFEDTYRTIRKPSEGIYKDKGSKFIALAFPVSDEEEVKEKLAEVQKRYHDARHHCYAYRLGFDKLVYRINDDGEPAGTAGKPIFGQFLSNDLTNILVVVVRYFGGTKLGISGLIKAYKSATIEALNEEFFITKKVWDVYEVHFNYDQMNDVMKILKEDGLKQLDQQFDLECMIKFSVRKKITNDIYDRFNKIKNLRIKYLQTI